MLLTPMAKPDTKRTRIFVLCSCLCGALLALSACAPSARTYIRPGIDLRTVTKVAVMPFENLTTDRYAGKKIQNLMITELLRTRRVDVVEPGEIYKIIRASDLLSLNALSIENIKNIGRQLNVQAVLLGSVHAFGVARGVTVSYPEVTLHCMLFDTASGAILASTEQTSGGTGFWTRHFKAEGPTLDETAEDAVKVIVRSIFLR